MTNGFTNISVRDTTKQRLAARGRYGDSLDSIINRVLDESEDFRALKSKHKPKHTATGRATA
jgi:L-rhamnose isomerase